MVNCPSCGSPVTGGFCSMCGFSLAAALPPPAQQPQSSQPPPPPQQPQYPQQPYQQPYQQPGQPYPYQPPGGSKNKLIGIIVGVIVVVVILALLFVFLGGDRVGTCVVRWGGGTPTQYMEGWTESECNAKCEELQNELSCYWEG